MFHLQLYLWHFWSSRHPWFIFFWPPQSFLSIFTYTFVLPYRFSTPPSPAVSTYCRSSSSNHLWLPRWLSGKELACQCRRTKVRSVGQEDPLEEEMATHSSILVWRMPTDSDGWRATAHEVTKSRTWQSIHTHTVPPTTSDTTLYFFRVRTDSCIDFFLGT